VEAALAIVDQLALADYPVFHVVRADLLRRVGRTADAVAAYDAAIVRTENVVERKFLLRKRAHFSPERSE